MTELPTLPKFCPNCGAANDGRQFCANCGAKLTSSSSTTAPVVAAVAPPTPAAVAASPASTIQWAGAVVLAGGIMAIAGSFLPWISATAAFIGTISRNGFDGGGDGLITVVIGLVITLLGVGILARAGKARTLKILALVGAAVLAAIAVADINTVNERIATVTNTAAIASLGTGLILIALAAVVTAAGAVIPTPRVAAAGSQLGAGPNGAETTTGPKPNYLLIGGIVVAILVVSLVAYVILKQQVNDILSRVGQSV